MYQPFNLLFYRGNSLWGRLIKNIESGKYSHCAMFIDQFHLLETAWNNPSVIKHFSYRKNTYDVYEINVHLTQVQKEIILQHIRENIRVGYDYIYTITRGLNILFGTKVINSKKFKACDELIVEAFEKAGIQLHDKTVLLSPNSLSKSKYLREITNK